MATRSAPTHSRSSLTDNSAALGVQTSRIEGERSEDFAAVRQLLKTLITEAEVQRHRVENYVYQSPPDITPEFGLALSGWALESMPVLESALNLLADQGPQDELRA